MSAPERLLARLRARVGPLDLSVELDTEEGTLAVVGPNGAGKTTLLSLLLGVIPALHGRVSVGDAVLLDTEAHVDVPVEQRRLGYVPQGYALLPHLSVRQNVAFAIQSAGEPRGRREQSARVDAILGELSLGALAARRPESLSGGEKQRVALARALVVRPRALLLDEPLAALDVNARRDVRRFLGEHLRSLALPTVVVTHDPADARALATRVLVLERGHVTQVGTWADLERSPASDFVRELVRSAGPP